MLHCDRGLSLSESMTVALLDIERRAVDDRRVREAEDHPVGCTAASASAVVIRIRISASTTPSCGVKACWCPPGGVSKAGKAGGALKVVAGEISRGAFAGAGGGSERAVSDPGWNRRGGGGPAKKSEPIEPLLVEPLPADAALASALG